MILVDKADEEKAMKELEIYIHIPFCIKKCAYCDFLSMEAESDVQETYIQALLNEIAHTNVDNDYQVISVFIGGGTPSVLRGEWIGRILAKLKSRFTFRQNVEISIECNPGTVNEEKLNLYQQAGVNRISFGLQSCNDQELQRLGRIHSYETFLESYKMARAVGFKNINVDLMSGLPAQTLADWERSLCQVAQLGPEHISAYSLIVEEGTPFALQELSLPDEETERLMYERTHELLEQYGYKQYEISNYAKDGFACRHNIGYWQRISYLGMGLGAASLVQDTRYSNTGDMAVYLNKSHEPDSIRYDYEVLDQKARMEEFLFLGLRMLEGIRLEDFEHQFSAELLDIYGEQINKMVNQGLLFLDGHSLKLTRQGISLSNYVFSEFLL